MGQRRSPSHTNGRPIMGAGDAMRPTADRLEPFSVRAVRVSGLLGERIDLTWRKNLRVLDWDNDFLAPFQSKSADTDYVGLGKTLEALVRIAAYTNDAEALALRRRVVDATLAAQLPDGYLGRHRPEARVTKLWDVHEMAYLLLALVTDWRLFKEPPSLDGARRLGDYLINSLTPEAYGALTADRTSQLATLGLDRAMLALYGETGDARYREICANLLNLPGWNTPIEEGRKPPMLHGHVYAFLCRCLAQLELHDMTGDARLTAQSHLAMDHLLKQGGLMVTGTAGDDECWRSDQKGAGDMGETCATAYLIRLCGKLLRMEGAGVYGDLMERAIYNALLAAQSPDGRKLRYYVPFEGERVYWDRDTYCCPGNFRRIVSELPEMVYYRDGDGVLVNLYCESRLSTALGDTRVEIWQETDYPNSGGVVLGVEPASPAAFTVSLRIPAWCRQATAAVNDNPMALQSDGGFLNIRREWRSGDRVTLNMETPWRLVRGFANQEGRVAVLRGPMLFALNPNRNPGLAGKALSEIALDPDAFEPPVADNALRPHGVACNVKATRAGHAAADKADLDLQLTEFADPDARWTYFRQAGPASAAMDDELLHRP